MNRSQLFSRVLSIMLRSGSLWLVTLAVTAVNVIIGLVLPGVNFVQLLVRTLLELITAAFLTGALISQVNAVAEGQGVGAVDAFQAGARKFLPLLVVGFVLAIPTWLILQLLDAFITPITNSYLNAYLQSGNLNNANDILGRVGVLACCLTPLILLALALVAAVTGALRVGAERAVTLETPEVWASLKRAWGLMMSRLSDFLVIGLMMLAILVGVGILFGCPAIIIITIASGVSFSAGAVATSLGSATEFVNIFIALLGIPLTILFSGVWTLAFRHWQGKEGVVTVTSPTPYPPVLPGA